MDLSGLLDAVTKARGAVQVRPGERLRIGVGDAARAAVIASLARESTSPLLVLVPRASHALALLEELGVWLGSEAKRLRHFPQRDALPYENAAEDPWDVRSRLEVLALLHSGGSPVIVASIEAAAQHTLSPVAAGATLSQLTTGQRTTPEELLRSLLGSGYEIVSLVEAPGQAARRGGIVDVFAPQAPVPLRIEFFGPAIESIRSFDPATQRSLQRLQDVSLGAASEFSPDRSLATHLLQTLDFTTCSEEAAASLRYELGLLSGGGIPAEGSFLTALLSTFSLLDHLPAGTTVILDEAVDLNRALDEYIGETASMRLERESRGQLPIGLPAAQANWSELQPAIQAKSLVELSRFGTEEDGSLRPPFSQATAFAGRVRVLANEMHALTKKSEAVVIVSQQASRLTSLLLDEGVSVQSQPERIEQPLPGVVQLLRGALPHGWQLRLASGESLTLLTDAEVFGFIKQRRALKQPGHNRSNLIADLSPGDYVVHLEHGIARFSGLVVRSVEGVEKEFLQLDYAEGDRLFVPVEQADRVARYVGPGESRPGLTRLGSGEWTRTRDRVRRAVAEVAHDLLELYASRQLLEGHAFSPDTPWQQELEASFPYIETPDQITAIREVKTDMETQRPMDRLICGDVGYGKTEIAIRAAFKAVMDGYQVAILVPTTVLAQQHYNTFTERLASLPASVAVLSRFLHEREQQDVLKKVADASVDVLIGTHRILQKDVKFKKLGLVIIDEEQRFGVAHKERLKQMRREVDVLTLSATPIPRTLHMSLIGIRDLSNMTTPPEDRLPIRTYVMEWDDQIIHEAITRELERGGQVFFVHNRVFNIELIAARIRELVPDARVGIGHGQMHEDQLERTMLDFAHGKTDVLVCTTIIESGLDIPNANTIIINQADRLGLAQLYQLRGRVGRGQVRAYAYLLYDRSRSITETAQRRLQAIFEATELGAGLQIAMKDLEIRGAGNLLGSEQSGHIASVGFDLYVRLLSEAVERLKAVQRGEIPPEPLSSRPAVVLDLPLTAYLPDAYIPDLNLRLAIYQRLAEATQQGEVEAIEQELGDRFGVMPLPARNLTWLVRLRLLASASSIGAIQTETDSFVVRLMPGRELRREALRARLGPSATVLSHQVRLSREAAGDSWREQLVRCLAFIGDALAVAV